MTEHYFSETPAGDFTPREIEVVLAGEPRTVVTGGGVFSPEHLDGGTAVLLRTLEGLRNSRGTGTGTGTGTDTGTDTGTRTDADTGAAADEGPGSRGPAILDLGCGWGPIALSAALGHPDAEVWAVDVNERARRLTAKNATRLGLTQIRVAAPDEVPSGVRFAEIHSNPPIRVGKQALHDMLSHWLPRLAPGGVAYLVVAKHLGAESLQKWIAAEFADLEVSRVARDKGFHVIQCEFNAA